jgi:hypothetical protein
MRQRLFISCLLPVDLNPLRQINLLQKNILCALRELCGEIVFSQLLDAIFGNSGMNKLGRINHI